MQSRRGSSCALWAALTMFTVSAAMGQPYPTEGKWGEAIHITVEAPYTNEMWAIHAVLLPNGKILVWGKPDDVASVCDVALLSLAGGPAICEANIVGTPGEPGSLYGHNWFCAGHASLPSGALFLAGGSPADGKTSLYVPNMSGQKGTIVQGKEEAWGEPGQPPPFFQVSRFYPTVSALPMVSGRPRFLVTDGTQTKCAANTSSDTPAIWSIDPENVSAWSVQPLYNARYNTVRYPFDLPTYPLMFMLADGTFFNAGGHNEICPTGQTQYYFTRRLDPSLASWHNIPQTQSGIIGASAVLVGLDRVVKAGGPDPSGSPATNRVQTVNLSTDSDWVEAAPMGTARDDMYLVALPSGDILAVGGDAGTRTESYNLTANQWTQLAVMPVPRLYHTSVLVIPSGAVFVAGGDDDDQGSIPWITTYSIYEPPYMFWEGRPQFSTTWSPPVLHYGQALTVPTPDANNITKVRLMRLGAATHSFDHNQRFLELNFTIESSTELAVAPPANEHLAPAGYYMLFIAKGPNGNFPSEGKIVQLLPAP